VSRLPAFVFEQHPEREAARSLCLSHRLPTATVAELNEVIDRLADQMKYKREIADTFIELDLKDVIALSGYILLKGGTERIYVREYRERVERRVLELIDTDPVIAALGRGEAVGEGQLIELERTLRQTLGAGDLEITESNIHKAFGFKVGSLIEFVRQLLDLDGVPDYADIVRRQFDGYVAAHPFNADQTRFLRALQTVFVQKRRLQLADLYAPPLSAFGADAVERYFTPEQVQDVLAFTDSLSV
jgi:type I restriction enzyme R subunit